MTDGARASLIEARFTPSQELVMEVLAARVRLGEAAWTFRSKHGRAIGQLQDLGYVWSKYGSVESTLLVGLTDAGKDSVLGGTYAPPERGMRTTLGVLPS